MKTPSSDRQSRLLENARVSDAMTTGVISCPPETPLRAVARLMMTHRVHAVFVLENGSDGGTGQQWGVVSDLDLVAAARGPLNELTAGEASLTPIVSVRSDDQLGRAAQLMAESGVSHLAVIDRATRRPAGVLSTLDIARVIASDGR